MIRKLFQTIYKNVHTPKISPMFAQRFLKVFPKITILEKFVETSFPYNFPKIVW